MSALRKAILVQERPFPTGTPPQRVGCGGRDGSCVWRTQLGARRCGLGQAWITDAADGALDDGVSTGMIKLIDPHGIVLGTDRQIGGAFTSIPVLGFPDGL